MDTIGIEELTLSPHRPAGFVATPPASLLEKLQDHGVIEPIVARPSTDGRYEILANPEIWVAAGKVGLTRVPVVVRRDLDDDEAAEIVRTHYGSTRRNPVDEAKYFASRLEQLGGRKKHGAITKLSVLTGHKRPYIAHSLRLLKLPEQVKELIRTGQLSAGQARPLISVADRAAQLELARKASREGLSARQVEARAKSIRNGGNAVSAAPPVQNHKPTKSADIVHLERLVSEAIGTEFVIEGDKAVINFFGNLEILEGVLNRIGIDV